MILGGIMLSAGTVLNIAAGDYLPAGARIGFLVDHIVCVHDEWVTLDGTQRPGATPAWRSRRVRVRVSALKRSAALVA